MSNITSLKNPTGKLPVVWLITSYRLKLKNIILSYFDPLPYVRFRKSYSHSWCTNLVDAFANSHLSPAVLMQTVSTTKAWVSYLNIQQKLHIMAGTAYEMLGDRELIPSGTQ